MGYFEHFIDKLYASFETGKPLKDRFADKTLTFSDGVSFYENYLLEKCSRIFEWRGLPFDQKAVELPVLMFGYAGFCYDDEWGDFICVPGGLKGVTPFPDVFTQFVYAAPKCKGGTKLIYPETSTGDAVLINNTTLRNSIAPMISRYAALLAHADTSIRDSLINIRYNEVMTADGDSEVESLKDWHRKIVQGEFSPVVDSKILNRPPVIPLSLTGKGQIALDTIEARQEILRCFFQEIGLRMNKDKRGNMIEDEVSANDATLLFNISDMLKQREAAADYINRRFDLVVRVELSKEYRYLTDPDKYDGDN